MKRICGILTLAVGVGLAGCANDSMANRDTTSDQAMGQRDRTVNSGYQADPNTVVNTDPNAPQVNFGGDKRPNMLSTDDRNFVANAIAGGMYEMQAGQIEITKGTNDSIKKTAQQIVDDHAKINLQLNALAQTKGVRTPVGISSDQQNMIDQLNKLSGADLDSEYLRQQRQAHLDTINKFQTASDSAADRDVRSMAERWLPALREHLTMINTDTNTNNTPNNPPTVQ